jgi:hypothetical protein
VLLIVLNSNICKFEVIEVEFVLNKYNKKSILKIDTYNNCETSEQ